MDVMQTLTIQSRDGEGETYEIQVRKVKGVQDARMQSADLPAEGSNCLKYFISTSTMTEGDPPIGDAKILHMEWDNTGGWTTQAAFGHGGARTLANAMALRSMSRGNWGDWQTLLDLAFPVGSVYITSENTNPSSIIGGTWTLSHKRFAYQIIENPVTYNMTNTTAGVSTAVLNGETIQLRMTYAVAVDIADTTIEIGQLDLDKIGLTGKYSEILPYMNDGGGGIGMLQISNAGLISNIEVIAKSGGTIAASANTGQVRASLMFGQGSMVDSFCDEFHWIRTA